MADLYDHDSMIAALDDATDRLLGSLDKLSDDDVAEPSLLPDWTRGHVLAHVARNAEAMRNLVTWAHTGVETPAYESRERRDADIDRDAARPIEAHRRDITDTARLLTAAARELPAASLDTVTVRTQPGREFKAKRIMWHRMREVEIHHVDLAAGYTPRDWPEEFVSRCAPDMIDMFARRDDIVSMTLRATDSKREWQLGSTPAFRVIAGQERFLLAWLIGRSSGEELTMTPSGSLPELPPWS